MLFLGRGGSCVTEGRSLSPPAPHPPWPVLQALVPPRGFGLGLCEGDRLFLVGLVWAHIDDDTYVLCVLRAVVLTGGDWQPFPRRNPSQDLPGLPGEDPSRPGLRPGAREPEGSLSGARVGRGSFPTLIT